MHDHWTVVRMIVDNAGSFIFAIVVVVVLLVLYVGWEICAAWREVLGTDKGKYFVCEKHGPMPAHAVIKAAQPTGDPVDVCPVCYEDAFQVADKRLRDEEERRAASIGAQVNSGNPQ